MSRRHRAVANKVIGILLVDFAHHRAGDLDRLVVGFCLHRIGAVMT